jgi:preprotein translocase subunit SecE
MRRETLMTILIVLAIIVMAVLLLQMVDIDI